MVIIDTLLIGGIRFVLDKVAAAVETELNDDTALREQLLAAQMRVELGEMSEDDFAVFEELFPLYFGSGGPVMQNAGEEMSEDEQQMLQAALQALSGRLQQLMEWLTSGEGSSRAWRNRSMT